MSDLRSDQPKLTIRDDSICVFFGGGGYSLTCDRLSMAGTLPTSNEDDIALCGPDIVAFQKEELIDTVVLKSRDFDYGSDWAGEALLDDEILLALDLHRQSAPSQ